MIGLITSRAVWLDFLVAIFGIFSEISFFKRFMAADSFLGVSKFITRLKSACLDFDKFKKRSFHSLRAIEPLDPISSHASFTSFGISYFG